MERSEEPVKTDMSKTATYNLVLVFMTLNLHWAEEFPVAMALCEGGPPFPPSKLLIQGTGFAFTQ